MTSAMGIIAVKRVTLCSFDLCFAGRTMTTAQT
ncbi:hypothetical protein M2272_000630 [Mycobacterium frederiksbergense]|uniref:Uncharacterized protein n=1 Tax=Mycolicibacterium frederiksbergense TaxID=117567 RepID=A0ABT6KTG0_9MYCO|nr:hypothetical protein [Mycolicibacterium frederiksbergense]